MERAPLGASADPRGRDGSLLNLSVTDLRNYPASVDELSQARQGLGGLAGPFFRSCAREAPPVRPKALMGPGVLSLAGEKTRAAMTSKADLIGSNRRGDLGEAARAAGGETLLG